MSETNIPSFDLSQKLHDLEVLINEGHQKIGESMEPSGILLMGETGAGKTTLAYLLAGYKLKALQNEEGELFYIATEEIKGMKISNKKISETKMPIKIKSLSGSIWDCPGFADIGQDPIQDIANAFYLKRLLETVKETKFILVVTEYDLQGRGGNLLRNVKHFGKLFKDINFLKDSLILVITHASKNKKIEHVRNTLKNILEQNQNLQEDKKIRDLLIILRDHVYLFYKPENEGDTVGNNENLLKLIESETKYSLSKIDNSNIVISENSIPLANKFFEANEAEIFKSTIQFLEQVSTIFCQQGTNLHNSLENARIIDIDSKSLKESKNEHLKYIININYVKNIGVLLENVLTEHKDPLIILKKIISAIDNIKSIILNYLNNQDAIDSMIIIKKGFLKINFIQNFCKKTFNFMGYIPFYNDFHSKIKNLGSDLIATINIEENEENIAYYDAVKKLVIQNRILVGLCFYHIGKIKLKLGFIDEAIKYLIASHNQNNVDEKAILLIDEIIKKDKLKINLIEGKPEILQKIINLHQKELEVDFEKLNIYLLDYISKKQDNLIIFIEKQIEIYKNLNSISSLKICLDVFKFLDLLSTISKITNYESMNNCEKNVTFINNINIALKAKYNDIINTWSNNFVKITVSIAQSIFQNISKLERPETKSKDPTYYIKIINFANLKIKITIGLISDDPYCIELKTKSYFRLGCIYLKEQKFKESELFFIESIKLNPNFQDKKAYRKIDQIYFMNKGINSIDKILLNELLNYNINILINLLNLNLFDLVRDYFDNRQLFKNIKELNNYENDVEYLENYEIIMSLLKEMMNNQNLDNYSEITKIIEKEGNKDIINEYINKRSQNITICQKVIKINNLFKEEIIKKQFKYIKYLSTQLNIFNSVIYGIFEKCLNFVIFQNNFQLKLESLIINKSENNISYYERIYKLLNKGQTNKKTLILKMTILFKIGEIYSKKKEYDLALENLTNSLKWNLKLKEECELNKEMELYYKNSIKRKICEFMGNIYFEQKLFEKALEYYNEIQYLEKIEKCYREISENSETADWKTLEKNADTLVNFGLFETSIKLYNKILFLTDSYNDHSRIYQKMANLAKFNMKFINICEDKAAKCLANKSIEI